MRNNRLAALLTLTLIAGGCATTTVEPPGAAMSNQSMVGHEEPMAPVGPVGPNSDPFGGSVVGGGASGMSDLMDPTDPFAKPISSSVNVFGEVDGGVQSPFAAAGKAGFQQHTFVEEGYDADVQVSPDSKWLLYSSTRHGARTDIYLQRVDGLAVTRLTDDIADDAFPTFSPDGQQIAFASNRSGNWDIFVMNAQGKQVRQVSRGPAQEIHPSFSPDGTRLVYSQLSSRSGQWELWTVDLRTSEQRMIGYGLFPTWSPATGEDKIAFQRARQRGTRWFSLWTLTLIDGEARNMTEVAFSSSSAIVTPTWSPDGSRLAFSTVIDPSKADPQRKAAVHGTQQDVWTVSHDGTDRQRLTDGRGVNATPAWSRDNRIFFISDRAGTDAVWSVRADSVNFSTAAVPITE
jgi:TolB protein